MLARTTWLGTVLGSLAAIAAGCGNSSGDDGNTPDGATAVDATPDAPPSGPFVAVPLMSLNALSYTAPLQAGGQSFSVIVDTGSSSTGVAGSTCTSCQASSKYTAGTGAVDEQQTAQSQYGDGTGWDGEIFQDTAAVGAGPSVALKFASITTDSGFFRGGYDGIMGLGPDASLLPGTSSYLSSAIQTGMGAEIAFQLCPNSGTMWLGGYDASAMAAAPVYSKLQQGALGGYYAIGIAGASLGGTDIGVTSSDFGPTIIDTGTSISFVPSAVLTKLSAAVSGSTGYQALFAGQTLTSQNGINTASSSADIDAMLPPMGITLPGSSTVVSIPATKSYLTYGGSQGGRNYYLFAFDDSANLFGGQINASLFGDSLLAGVVAVFDFTNKQVGFAPQQGCTEPAIARDKPAIVHTPGVPWWREDPRVRLPPALRLAP